MYTTYVLFLFLNYKRVNFFASLFASVFFLLVAMNFIKKFIGTTTTDEVALIPSGKLYLTRSKQSPKGAIECLYNDAFASIKKTTSPYYYQLCITKVYQEGEADFNRFDDSEEEYDGEELAPTNDTRRQSKDEWIFPIADELKIHVCEKEDGSRAIAWKDVNGDLGDKFEFVIDEEVRGSEVEAFGMTIYKCLFENKYQTSYAKVNDPNQLKEFIYNPKGELLTFDELKDLNDLEEYETDEYEDCETSPIDAPKGETKYASTDVDLHLYDTRTGTFILHLAKPDFELKLIDLGNWEYTLYIHGETTRINTTLSKNMNPTFNYQHLSFIFNDYTVDEGGINACSWLVKFPDYNDMSKFQTVFLGLMYETLNRRKWGETEEHDYFVDAFSRVSIGDAKDLESEEEEESEEENEGDGPVKWETEKNEKNSSLTVGYAKDRSYVVRGDKIGVFSEDDAGQLNFQTAITNVADLKGKHFSPEKMLLHQQDQYMIISNPQFDDKALYKMDLTRGKIVEEWEVSKDVPVKSYAPTSKFAQLTDEQTLTGISSNGLFTIDPRLSGTKLVNDKTYKAYKTTNNQFQTLATTDKGYIALGSGKGDIRLFDRLGANAKTALPSLGDPIIGIDVSKDGRWLLATCKTYLLLIDNKISDGQKNAGKLGFTNYFDKDKKPTPRRLALKPEHEAYMVRENGGKQLLFTPAYFNTGRDSKETTIVTSLGKYVVTWSMGKVLLDKENPYLVKRYTQNVIADNFKFGSNNEVIMALQDDVSMVSRRSLANPKNVFK